jgi:hypothetical protein
MTWVRIVCVAGFIILVLTSSVVGQQPNGLNDLVDLHVRKARVDDILVKLAVQCEVPMGFERSDLDGANTTLDLDVSRKTVFDVLNLIIEKVPIYRWEIRNRVVNVVPVQGRSALLEKFLSIEIVRFDGKGDMIKFDLRNRILELPQVKAFLDKNNLHTERLRDYSYKPSIYANDADLGIQQTDVIGVLNNIVAKSEYNLWIVSIDANGSLHLIL